MKRFFDLGVLVLFSWLWLPLLLIVALVVRIFMGAPVFFVQERGGFKGTTFRLLKFRSMIDARDSRGQLLPDSERMNVFSRILRNTSLDELPGLLNVLKGDMSLVGPRPLLTDYLSLYSPRQARRHDVKPGITGWAQVNGRNAISWDKKFELDVWYVEHRSFLLDMRILALTALRFLRPRGISQAGHATAERFRGGGQ